VGVAEIHAGGELLVAVAVEPEHPPASPFWDECERAGAAERDEPALVVA
jgi:hypothetical protein